MIWGPKLWKMNSGKPGTWSALAGRVGEEVRKLKPFNRVAIAVERVWGENRYDTVLAVARRFETQDGYVAVSIATGRNYPDALTGAVHAANYKSFILLVDQDTLGSAALEYLNRQPLIKIYILGGTGAVSDSVISQIEKLYYGE